MKQSTSTDLLMAHFSGTQRVGIPPVTRCRCSDVACCLTCINARIPWPWAALGPHGAVRKRQVPHALVLFYLAP